MNRNLIRLAALAAGVTLMGAPVRAEDERGRWTFGLGLGVLSTKDDIRSNAASLLLNERGEPGDPADDTVQDGSTDLRLDDLLGRETSVEERQTYGLSVAYGLTSWLSLQMDVGYYEGNVSNLDTFRVNRYFSDDECITSSCDGFKPDDEHFTPFKDASVPLSAGRLQQIPVSFSAIFRFRKDSPFNPILGAGVGKIFTDFEESDTFNDMNDAILRGFQRTQYQDVTGFPTAVENPQIIQDRFGNIIGSTDCTLPAQDPLTGNRTNACSLGIEELERQLAQEPDPFFQELLRQQFAPWINEAFIPRRPFVTAHVEDAFEYHFMGGAEYHFDEKWSAFFLGRYTFTRANLKIRISDNGNLVTPAPTANASQAIQFDTDQAKFIFLSESNPTSSTRGDTVGLYPKLLTDEIIVQGGEINLSGFTLAFGLRYTF